MSQRRPSKVEAFVDVWFTEQLYEHNALAMSHDQIGQRWIDAFLHSQSVIADIGWSLLIQ
jgi:hypothetical protein